MKQKLTADVVRKLPLEDVDIWDAKYPGLVLRCRASGKHTYRVTYGRGKWVTLGRADVLTPDEAREQARDQLTAIAKGHDPQAARKEAKAAAAETPLTLRAFITTHLEPAVEHQKRGKETIQRLRSVFVDLLDHQLAELTAWTVEKWRSERLKQTPRPKRATVNSHLTMLKSALAKAIEWKKLTVPAHPLSKVKRLRVDKTGRVRYLTPEEETRLRQALEARDTARDARREQANTWRRERGYALWPADNADHLTTIVVLALNTGLRKGEIFNLRWTDIDVVGQQLTVEGEGETREDGAKSVQTRYVPLNREALEALQAWRTRTAAADGHVFPGRDDGERLDDVKKAWLPVVKAAKLTNFRFHDLRHTFASKLVMAGVDLNTVRELLGHADMKMTIRYAHLAPEHKAAAVAKLNAQ
jgi:integrase